jgi:hypothetical protein
MKSLSLMSVRRVVPPAPPMFEVGSFGGYLDNAVAIEGVSFWPRVAARVIDLLVHYFIGFGAAMFFGILLAVAAGITGHSAALQYVKLRQVGMIGFITAILGSLAYNTICEGVHGSTLGKRVLSIGGSAGGRFALSRGISLHPIAGLLC